MKQLAHRVDPRVESILHVSFLSHFASDFRFLLLDQSKPSLASFEEFSDLLHPRTVATHLGHLSWIDVVARLDLCRGVELTQALQVLLRLFVDLDVVLEREKVVLLVELTRRFDTLRIF